MSNVASKAEEVISLIRHVIKKEVEACEKLGMLDRMNAFMMIEEFVNCEKDKISQLISVYIDKS